jgi:hypothetical protein
MPFTGRATYDTLNGQAVFDGTAEDVSPQIGMISPKETPLLDLIGDGDFAAQNVYHEWLEETLNPSTIIATTAIASVTTSTSLLFTDSSGRAMARHLQVGMQLKINGTGEYLQITAIDTSNNVVQVSRAFGSTSAASWGAGGEVLVVGPVTLEGADMGNDISRARVRKGNYCQIFDKAVIISGTEQATRKLGGVSSEFELQTTRRLTELMREFEKTIIHGKSSGNSLGGASAYRTMKGLWDFIATNVTTTGATSVTPDWLNDRIQACWEQGGQPTDIVVGADWKKIIDGFNNSRVEVIQGSGQERAYKQTLTTFESSFGELRVHLNRWMAKKSLMILSPERVKVVPLAGRSFQVMDIARTGDSLKRMIVGEYTLEVKNEEGMAKAFN